MDAETFMQEFRRASRRPWVVAAGILVDAHAADDVLQEAALIAWRKRAEFRPGTNFAAWICQIARHVALRARQARSMRIGLEIDRHEISDTHGSPNSPSTRDLTSPAAQLPERLGLSDELARALSSLDETARACLLLRTVLDCSYEEIAELLQLPQGTAMSHVHRSRQRLKELLSAEGLKDETDRWRK